MIEYIRTNGLNEEGILRIGASIQRAQGLCDELSKLYASSLTRECSRTLESMMSQLLAEYSICDSIAVFKQFIRRLPEPLLSFRLMDAFLVVASKIWGASFSKSICVHMYFISLFIFLQQKFHPWINNCKH